MAVSPEQQSRFCEQFLSRIQPTEYYTRVCQLLLQWQGKKKSAVGAIEAFVEITNLLRERQQLVLQLNKCLDKEASIPLKSSRSDLIDVARNNDNYNRVFDCVQNFIKSDVPSVEPIPQPSRVQELTDREVLHRIQAHPHSKFIIKSLHLFMKCIITLGELRKLLYPIHNNDRALFQHLSQLAQDIQVKRRKVTIFAPLNELVDQRYPVERIGRSYIIIPDGYANYGAHWGSNPFENTLNRKCVSVPLGQQSSFIIARKNQFQQQLFENESEKYEIDNVIQTLQITAKQIQKGKRVEAIILLEKVLVKLYPNENIYKIVLRKPQALKQVILPRINQKLEQLILCRQKFERHCQQIALKNFQKSLDYRCFYFKRNDKKFNCQTRYEKEISMRVDQLALNEEVKEGIEDRESLQKPRNFTINSFDNITKEKFVQDHEIKLQYDRKLNAEYPRYPGNQILFILNFENRDVLNDVLELILFHCTKKSLFQLLIFKMMGICIERRLTKDYSSLNCVLKTSSGERNSGENADNSNINNISSEYLNEKKQRKNLKENNVYQDFEELIQQEIQANYLQDVKSPFEGPDDHTFIATKPVYIFMRFLLTLYQRMLRAKDISEEKRVQRDMDQTSDTNVYNMVLAVLTLKFKDVKLSEHLRTIFKKEAYIFLSLDKLINSLVKTLNNIGNQSLTYKMVKEGMKDYEMEIRKWSQYRLPSTYQQLVRVVNQKEMLFRFSYVASEGNIYISAWNNEAEELTPQMKNMLNSFVQGSNESPTNRNRSIKNQQPAENFYRTEYFLGMGSNRMNVVGEELVYRSRPASQQLASLEKAQRELSRLKKVKVD